MQKYAMIPICFKYNEEDQPLIRRVLISYDKIREEMYREAFKCNFFTNTKFLAKDAYFDNPDSSHQYQFKDDGYYLVDCTNINKPLYDFDEKIYNFRPYHTIVPGQNLSLPEELYDNTFFEAISDEEAIKTFNEREELR